MKNTVYVRLTFDEIVRLVAQAGIDELSQMDEDDAVSVEVVDPSDSVCAVVNDVLRLRITFEREGTL
jgi:hypothetical protein